MSSPFDYVKSIQETGEDIWIDGVSDKDYTPFVINRGLAQNLDTLMLAQEMNKRAILSPEMQYRYLLASIKKKKRYGKWSKKTELEDSNTLEMIARYYEVNMERAAEYLKLLTTEQIDEIRRLTFTGGRSK